MKRASERCDFEEDGTSLYIGRGTKKSVAFSQPICISTNSI